MEPQKVIISHDLEQALTAAIAEVKHDRLFVLVDDTTERLCLPVISHFECMQPAQTIVIGATDANKTLESLSHVWTELQRMGATRHSCLINLGGGMVTDLGGFDVPVEVSHEEVQEAADKAQPLMTEIMREMIIRSERVDSQMKEKFNTDHPTEPWK